MTFLFQIIFTYLSVQNEKLYLIFYHKIMVRREKLEIFWVFLFIHSNLKFWDFRLLFTFLDKSCSSHLDDSYSIFLLLYHYPQIRYIYIPSISYLNLTFLLAHLLLYLIFAFNFIKAKVLNSLKNIPIAIFFIIK